MKRCCAFLLVLLTGCGGTMTAPMTQQPTTQQPNYERRPPAVANPSDYRERQYRERLVFRQHPCTKP